MALLPVLPHGPMVNKDGSMTDQYKMFFSQFLIELRKTINQEGMLMPIQSSSNIAILNNPQSIAKVLYNGDVAKHQLNNYGHFQTITTGSDMTAAQINATSAANKAGQLIKPTDVANELYFFDTAGNKLTLAYT